MKFVSIESTGLRGQDHELIQLNILDGDMTTINIKAIKEPDEKAMKFNGLDCNTGMEREEFKQQYGGILEDDIAVFHCGKFTAKFLLNAGVRISKFIDIMEVARDRELPLRLNALAKHFNVEGTKCEKVKGVYEALNS